VTLVFSLVVWWSAQSTNRIAQARDRAEAARRALDQRIARLVEGISQGFLSFDRDLRLTYINARGEQMLHRGRRELLGASARAVFSGSLPNVAEATARALAEVDTFEFEAHFPELERWLEVHLIPSVDGMTVLCLDVTERRRREEERRELLESERAARAEAERANRIKDEFLATVSHELRTPLNAILGWAQILTSERARPTDLPQGLATIKRNAQLQAQLIDDLLDVARIVNGKLRLELARTDLREVLEAAVASVRQAADARGLTLSVVTGEAPVSVQGDAARLQQVVTNLLSNSIKFTPRGGSVGVHLVRMGPEVLVAVQDTGQGIEAELVPHMFERFRQADSSIRRKHGGLGLGLALVRSLVELHGGRVAVHSAGLGQGATFEVRLPVLADAEPEIAAPEVAPGRRRLAAAGRATLRGVRVLVVDDELDARLLAHRILEEAGATVQVAVSAEEALAMVRRDVPHVLVTDIGMPDVDGYELVRRLRALEPRLGVVVPTVALTAFVRDVDREKSRSAGFDAHIPKPLDPAALTATIAELAGVELIGERAGGIEQPSRAS
jgi:signal transduction histidine kinase